MFENMVSTGFILSPILDAPMTGCTKILVSCICYHMINLFRIHFALKFDISRKRLDPMLSLGQLLFQSSQSNLKFGTSRMSHELGCRRLFPILVQNINKIRIKSLNLSSISFFCFVCQTCSPSHHVFVTEIIHK